MRINGFQQIKAFYSWVFNNPDQVRPTHISLYLFLWNQGNRANWVDWFKCPYDLAMQGACIGNKGTYYRCLDDLQKFKLIVYKKGLNNYKAPQIHIIRLHDNEPLTEQVTVPLSEQVTVPQPVPLTEHLSEPLSELLSGNIYKLVTDNYETINRYLPNWLTNLEKEKNLLSEKKFSDEVFNCYEKCLKYFPEYLHPKKPKEIFNWQDTVDKLNRIEKIPFSKIIEITKSAREDDFWSKQFLSLTKLRTKDKNKIMFVVVFNEKFKSKNKNYGQVMKDTYQEILDNPDHIANHLKY